MKKRNLILFAFLLSTALCFAQKSITGIIQSQDKTPVEYANIVLLAQPDSAFITGTISDQNGSFVLKQPEETTTRFLIQVTCIGYKTICQPVNTDNIGTITLEDDAQMLGEVVVKANLPVTRLKGDAMITHIEGSVLEKAGTAQNVLDYIPGVTSQKGELTVLGRGTPIVYINNRLVRDDSELEQLSSDNIQSVEVINNPGARYDASVSAVIRIQTKKAIGDGMGFSNRTYASYNKEWDMLEQLNLNYRQGNLDIFGMLYLYKSYWWEDYEMIQDTRLSDNHWKQVMTCEETGKHTNITADFGMNYAFTPTHSAGFKYSYTHFPKRHTDAMYDASVFENESLYEQTINNMCIDIGSTQHSVNLYYNGAIKDWNIDFNVDLLWLNTDRKDDIQEKSISGSGEASEQLINTLYEARNNLYASKLVFSRPALGGNVAFGGELSYTDRNTNNESPQDIIKDDTSEIKENNVGAFAEFNRKFGKVQLQAGLRYEHVMFDYYQEGVFQNEQSKKYDHFFPSISISKALGKVQMQLGYTQDISRPSFHSLRSNVLYVNHYTYETGNPLLSPVMTHNFNLTSTYKWWQLYASYQRIVDNIQFSIEPYNEDNSNPNIVLIKPVNIKSYNAAYARLSASPTVAWWSPRFTLAVQKQWFEVETHEGKMNMNRPQFSFRWQNSLKLPAGFLFNLNGSWISKYDRGNISFNKASWYIDTGLYKGFIDDRLSFQLNGSDIFLTRKQDWTTHCNESYTLNKSVTPNTRSVSLTARYKFNQGKNKYKGTGAGDTQKNRL